jgi:formate hydrogenlyase transcriptional activator
VKVNQAALREDSIDAIFQSMCGILRNLLAYDLAMLALLDGDRAGLRIAALNGPGESIGFQVGNLFATASYLGSTFEQKTIRLVNNLTTDSRLVSEKRVLAEGYQSVCSVPLIVRDKSIGAVMLAGKRKRQFSSDNAQITQELSNQIALAVFSMIPSCPLHTNTRLFCPKCIGARGGKATVEKHREDLSSWGRQGGRGRTKQNFR